MSKARLHDPRERGPKPPFPQPPQSPPGDEDRMVPKADHGEKGYTGKQCLKDRVAMITGGDSGIGRAVALLYAQEGAKIVITSLEADADDGEETCRLVKEKGGQCRSIPGDVGDAAFCKELVDNTVEAFGGLDILINNAAYQRSHASIEQIPLEDVERTFRTNVFGTVYLTQAAAPHLRPGACIINTSSIQALSPTPQLALYASTKSAISSLTKSFAGLFADKGVRVNAVAPGPVWTPLIPSTLPEEKVRNFGHDTLLKRPAQPVEQAALFVFLASDDASFVTGEVFGATGGKTPI
ncbi:hypothetical protein DFR24_3417 [Panacagrimonas perspica]|uniref:Ketoreductase domain-containing protein n=1 Tax=Panacagrimonas perspica TaxID=381431 RepID=A0A4S3K226_9GAMM|nr:SDR family oxidoreductase [Panacagrimonas perspica]TDU26393.1 hypothetical protein DFR24_3417 [Panacagrimonas perspica]THD02030.1 NAD(P)-dependent oxidoreductase [Panacagrimonas perspica]